MELLTQTDQCQEPWGLYRWELRCSSKKGTEGTAYDPLHCWFKRSKINHSTMNFWLATLCQQTILKLFSFDHLPYLYFWPSAAISPYLYCLWSIFTHVGAHGWHLQRWLRSWLQMYILSLWAERNREKYQEQGKRKLNFARKCLVYKINKWFALNPAILILSTSSSMPLHGALVLFCCQLHPECQENSAL